MLFMSLLFMNSVNYVECNQEQLVLMDEEVVYDIDFFNVIFYEESNRLEACRYLKEASKIEIEEEKYVMNAYYIYIDGRLIQEIIVDNELGRQKIHYVSYLHNFEKDEQRVISNYNMVNRQNRSFYILGLLFLFVCLGFIFLLKV